MTSLYKESRPRLVALSRSQNGEWILSKWLERTCKFVDAIIMIDHGSTDRSVEILKSCPKVIQILQNPLDEPMQLMRDRNRLLKAAKKIGAEWVMILDIDEIMDVRFASRLNDILSQPDIGRIFFKEITLWRSNKFYRVDRPGMYNRDITTNQIIRLNSRLSWKLQRKHTLPYRVMKFFTTGKYEPAPLSGYESLNGIKGKTIAIPDLVKIHYHFTDWDRAWRAHVFYGVREAIQFKKSLNQAPEIAKWASDRLDETGLKLVPVKPEWGVL